MWEQGKACSAPSAPGASQDDGGLFWVPQGDGLVQPGQQGSAAGLAEAGLEGLPLLPSLQPAAPAPALYGLHQLDSGLQLQPPQSLPTPACAADASGADAGASSAMTTEAVDKQAIAREKNRLAQRRFREKERQKMAEAEAQADAMRRQLSQLRLENERLQVEHALLEKLLVVRDAILSVVVQLDALPPPQGQPAQPAWQPPGQGAHASPSAAPAAPSVVALLEDPAALQAASQQLAFALGELPSLEQMEAMVGQMGGSSGPEGGGSSSASGGSSSSALGSQGAAASAAATAAACGSAGTASPPPAGATVGAAAASGVVVDKSRLQGLVPLPCPAAQKEVESIEHVDSLLGYWQQWRLHLRELFREAQANQFEVEEQVEALKAHQEDFVRVFWAACHVRPQLFNLFLARCLPPPGFDASAQWTRIAEESLPLLRDGEVAVYRQAMQRYTKRVALAAVGVRPWVQRLQVVVAAQRGSAGSMTQLADQHSQVRDVVSRMQHACTEQYLAYMAFLADLSAHASITLRALWHSSSDPFAPDHPAIVSEILRLHQQRQRQRQQLAAPQPATAAV